jgi:hypothetical protein
MSVNAGRCQELVGKTVASRNTHWIHILYEERTFTSPI